MYTLEKGPDEGVPKKVREVTVGLDQQTGYGKQGESNGIIISR